MTEHDTQIIQHARTALVLDIIQAVEGADAETALLTLELVASALDEALNRIEEAQRS